MADIPKKVGALIDSIRGKLTTPSGRSLDQRRRGYQLYAKERQAEGESPDDYETWLKSQSAEIGGQ